MKHTRQHILKRVQMRVCAVKWGRNKWCQQHGVCETFANLSRCSDIFSFLNAEILQDIRCTSLTRIVQAASAVEKKTAGDTLEDTDESST